MGCLVGLWLVLWRVGKATGLRDDMMMMVMVMVIGGA